jgi:hypothetical protein
LEAFGDRAKQQVREYTVLAFDVYIDNIDLNSQASMIKGIYQQNPQLKGQVEVIQLE